MPRTARVASVGDIYHVSNREVGRQQLIFDDDDYLSTKHIPNTKPNRRIKIDARGLPAELNLNQRLWPKTGQASDQLRLMSDFHFL